MGRKGTTGWEGLERWAWRDGVELEWVRRLWRFGQRAAREEIEIGAIDWADIEALIEELAPLRGVEKLRWHWERAQLVRAGRIDWEQEEEEDRVFIADMCRTHKDDEHLSKLDDDRLHEILGPGTIANQIYGWS